MKLSLRGAGTLILLAAFLASAGCARQSEKRPKYIFLFIGDGMGFSHVSTAEAWQAHITDGEIGNSPLSFTQFPVLGTSTTYSASNWITDSSASGTAIATGRKTNNGYIGVAPDDSTHLESIAVKLHKTGMKVGIMTSVSIDHATPASFYAHNGSRYNYYDVGSWLPKSGFEFFGGAPFISPEGKAHDRQSIYAECRDSAYQVFNGLSEFNAKSGAAKKVILLPDRADSADHIPYALSRRQGQLRLDEILGSAIGFLDNPDGFFIMCEGGMIDWAAHDNDALNDIYETLDLSKTVEKAVEFYRKHPDETLIIVTADHETGGMALGAGGEYNVHFDRLEGQTAWYWDVDEAQRDTISTRNAEARIGWTTGGHTGSAVPVYAIGAGSERFSGRNDNTDICNKLCDIMGVGRNK